MKEAGRRIWWCVPAVLFFLPVAAALRLPEMSWHLKILVSALAGAAAVHGLTGALALVVIVSTALPLATSGTGFTGTTFTECVVFAFASGSSLRAVWSRFAGRDLLGGPTLALASIVFASAVVDLSAERSVAPGQSYFLDLWNHVVGRYWTEDVTDWRLLHAALLWLAVLVTGLSIERICRESTERAALVWLWLGSIAAALTMTIVRVVEVITRGEAPWAVAVFNLLTAVRLSVLHPDPNAAGSILGFMFVAALIIGWRRRLWWMLGLVAPLLFVGFALAQSRAAIGAVIGVFVVRAIAASGWSRRTAVIAVGSLLVIAAAGTWMFKSRSHGAFGDAMAIRLQMTEVGLRMAERFPMWGVGIGDYQRTSRRFIGPSMPELAGFARGGENAHNNYLQIAVELGIPAGLTFLWLVGSVVVGAWRDPNTAAAEEAAGLSAGLAVFLVSALFGHPLLIPEVAALFFIGLGLTAGVVANGPRRSSYERRIALAVAAFYLASLFWRL